VSNTSAKFQTLWNTNLIFLHLDNYLFFKTSPFFWALGADVGISKYKNLIVVIITGAIIVAGGGSFLALAA
jgi:hypothetical protein